MRLKMNDTQKKRRRLERGSRAFLIYFQEEVSGARLNIFLESILQVWYQFAVNIILYALELISIIFKKKIPPKQKKLKISYFNP